MTTVKAFDDLMNQFLGELNNAFPDEPPKKGISCHDYIKYVSQWSAHISAKDPDFFCEENEFAKSLNLHVIWKREDCSDITRNAIWQYLSSMYMIATTMTMFPPETLNMIENVAEKYAKNMKVDPSGRVDEKMLMDGVNSMITQMLSGGSNPFATMLGQGLPAPPQTPAKKRQGARKKKSKK